METSARCIHQKSIVVEFATSSRTHDKGFCSGEMRRPCEYSWIRARWGPLRISLSFTKRPRLSIRRLSRHQQLAQRSLPLRPKSFHSNSPFPSRRFNSRHILSPLLTRLARGCSSQNKWEITRCFYSTLYTNRSHRDAAFSVKHRILQVNFHELKCFLLSNNEQQTVKFTHVVGQSFQQ
jgi:hypothetical protein